MLRHLAQEWWVKGPREASHNSEFRTGSKNINRSVMAAVCGKPCQVIRWYKGHKTQDRLSSLLPMTGQKSQQRRPHLRRNESIKGEQDWSDSFLTVRKCFFNRGLAVSRNTIFSIKKVWPQLHFMKVTCISLFRWMKRHMCIFIHLWCEY